MQVVEVKLNPGVERDKTRVWWREARGCTLLSCQNCDYSKMHISLSLSLLPPLIPPFLLSRHAFLSTMISYPLSSFTLIFHQFHSLSPLSSVSSSTPSPSHLSLTHPVCIIQVEIPACQAWPLNIHGGAAPRPFSAALPQRRSTSEGRERRGREEEVWRGEQRTVTEMLKKESTKM